MKLWIDDIRQKPDDSYIAFNSVNQVKRFITHLAAAYHKTVRELSADIELIDIDHDAGKFAKRGGDYIKLLDWFEETEQNYKIHIHSMNPVGVENMRAVIRRNGWIEV